MQMDYQLENEHILVFRVCLLSPTQPRLLRTPYPLNFHCGCFASLSSGKQLLISSSLFSLPDSGYWLDKVQ